MARDRRPLWPANQPPEPHNSTATPPMHAPHPLPASTPAESFKLFNDHLAASRGHMQSIDEALRSLNRGPRVLETRTLTIPSAAQEMAGEMTAGAPGVWVGDRYRIPFAAVAVYNPTNVPLIVSTGPAQSSAPGGGQGQAIVPPTSYAAWNMAGSQLSIYGTVGSTLTITVFADSVMPIVCDWGSNALMPGGDGLGNSLQTLTAHGIVTGPTAGQTICTINTGLRVGMQYSITAIVYMAGTTASPADDDNFKITINANIQAIIPISGAASPGPGVQPVTVTVPVSQGWNGSSNINLTAAAAATATAVYHGTLLATPLVPAA